MKTVWKLKGEKKEINKNNKNVLLQAIRELEGKKPKDPGFDSYLQRGFLNDCSFVSPKQCSFISLWFNPNLSG